MDCSMPGLSVSHHLPKFAQVHVHCITDGIQPSHPLTPSSPSSSSSSSSSSDTLFSFCPESNVYSESISPKIDWFYLLAVQETLKSLLQQHSLKASPFNALPSLWPSGHNHWEDHSLDYTDLCRQRNVSAFQLSRFVLTLLPRSKRLLISWLQSPSAVILEPKKRKSGTTSTFPPPICHEVMGLDAMIFVFLIFHFKPALSFSSFTLIKRLFSSFICSQLMPWLKSSRPVTASRLN